MSFFCKRREFLDLTRKDGRHLIDVESGVVHLMECLYKSKCSLGFGWLAGYRGLGRY